MLAVVVVVVNVVVVAWVFAQTVQHRGKLVGQYVQLVQKNMKEQKELVQEHAN